MSKLQKAPPQGGAFSLNSRHVHPVTLKSHEAALGVVTVQIPSASFFMLYVASTLTCTVWACGALRRNVTRTSSLTHWGTARPERWKRPDNWSPGFAPDQPA